MSELTQLLVQVREDIGHDPAAVFLTGGMSRAGYLQQAVAASFPNSRLVRGNPSFGVVHGLAWAACH